MTAGFPMPGQNIAFPGFPFGFPAQGFAGDGAGDEAGKGGGKVPSFMDSAGNIDFMKMAALVRSPPICNDFKTMDWII